MTEFAKAFRLAYKNKYDEFLEESRLRNALQALEVENSLLLSCINHYKSNQDQYPIILGNSMQRISITNIGTFPPYSYDSNYILPIGFTSKKRYKLHANYSRSARDKVLYICTVESDGPTILADDGYKWQGTNMWEQFSKDVSVDGEYSSFEEFAGLSRSTVIKLIEGLGDVSTLNGYIPYDKRHSN